MLVLGDSTIELTVLVDELVLVAVLFECALGSSGETMAEIELEFIGPGSSVGAITSVIFAPFCEPPVGLPSLAVWSLLQPVRRHCWGKVAVM